MTDLYGYARHDLDAAKEELQGLLNIRMIARDSLFQGGDYYRNERGSREEFILKNNVDPYEDEPDETDFPEYKILLYVSGISDVARASEIERAITQPSGNFVLLKRKSHS